MSRDTQSAQPQEEAWLRPHLEAVRASVRAGFQFRHLPSPGNLLAVQGFRVRSGAMDMFLARSADDALAARFRLADLDGGGPPALWHQHGAVADVVSALVELPAHGTAGAPRLARARTSELWIPSLT